MDISKSEHTWKHLHQLASLSPLLHAPIRVLLPASIIHPRWGKRPDESWINKHWKDFGFKSEETALAAASPIPERSMKWPMRRGELPSLWFRQIGLKRNIGRDRGGGQGGYGGARNRGGRYRRGNRGLVVKMGFVALLEQLLLLEVLIHTS